MDNVNNILEDVSVGINTISLSVPLVLTMISKEELNFDYTCYIDEHGQAVLTPVVNSSEFISAKIMSEDEQFEDNIEGDTKTFKITLSATILTENNFSEISVSVDDIGQCVLTPILETDMFISATIDDSLNLITEELSEVIYAGYQIVPEDDFLYVISPEGNRLNTPFSDEISAKIFICETELEQLNNKKQGTIKEDINIKETDDKNNDEKPSPMNVEAEVVEESIDTTTTTSESKVIIDDLKIITSDFTDSSGVISCETQEEFTECTETLSEHYDNIFSYDNNGNYVVAYCDESCSDTFDAHMKVVLRFLQGDITITSDCEDVAGLEHITELDSKDHEYYYDSDADVIICCRGN